MGKFPPLFHAALGVAGVALFVLLAFLLFGTPGSPLSAPAASSLTPPRPRINPTATLSTTIGVTATVAVTPTATSAITPTGVATTKPTPTATPTAVPILPTATTDPTLGWKTYENHEYGFRIKYPQHFSFRLFGSPGPEILHEMSFCDSTKYQDCISSTFPFVGLEVLANPQRLSLDAWAKAHTYTFGTAVPYSLQFESYQTVRVLNFRGIQALRLLATSAANGITGHLILVPHADGTKIIALYYHIGPATIEPIFELMARSLEPVP